MIIFIQVTNAKQGMRQLINLDLVESFTELKEGTLIHFKGNSQVTVKESFEIIKQKIEAE